MNLKKRFPAIAHSPILGTSGRDYAFRVVLPKAAWVQVLVGLAEEQTWSNFKNEATLHAADTGIGFVHKLHAVWSEMAELQSG